MGATTSWRVGDLTVTAIVEARQAWPAELFIPEITAEVIAANDWLRPDHVDERNWIHLAFQAFVVEADGARIVVDTCIGNHKPRSLEVFDHLTTTFLDDLTGAGFAPDSIDLVVCTHLHVDHVGWNTRLVDDRWVPTFPNARYLFGEREYAHWSSSDDDDQQAVMADSVAPIMDAGLATLVGSDHELTGSVRLEPTPGHTPGHHSVRLSGGAEEAVITGDLVHHATQVVHPEFCSVADVDPDQARATRRSFFDGCATDGTLMIGTHLPGKTAFHVVPHAETWRLI
jgi:glyoxylase-like metal-dependent hydrolase (beta-lactamase superfamily II)